ncbi:hypothetical protein MAFF241647_40920 (plasmid) [Ralstonia solanacearum]|nr:hypothetical protein MAFF241647_40920 [Ralstonia solanacearum]
MVGAGPFVLSLLHQQHRLREHLDVADVVGVGVRDRDIVDVSGLDAELCQLARQRFRPTPVDRLRIRRGLPIRQGGDGIVYARIPQEPALRVLDQVAIVGKCHRFADIHAW